MPIEYVHATHRGFYTSKDRALWEIEVGHSLRDLHVIAAGPESRDALADSFTFNGRRHYTNAPCIRIRDMYCEEIGMAEEQAVALTPTEARHLAMALMAAAEEYERYLDPVGHDDGDHLCCHTDPARR